MAAADKYKIINIRRYIGNENPELGEDELLQILSEFSCPKNPEIEDFVRSKAIDFAKRKLSITYLVFNDDDGLVGDLAGIFTLTHKALEIKDEVLTNTARKTVQRYAKLDTGSGSYLVSAFLLAQFGKNYAAQNGMAGNDLMDEALEMLKGVQHLIGGGVVYLDCENHQKLLSFYKNENNRFREFSSRFDETENIEYIQLMRFL